MNHAKSDMHGARQVRVYRSNSILIVIVAVLGIGEVRASESSAGVSIGMRATTAIDSAGVAAGNVATVVGVTQDNAFAALASGAVQQAESKRAAATTKLPVREVEPLSPVREVEALAPISSVKSLKPVQDVESLPSIAR